MIAVRAMRRGAFLGLMLLVGSCGGKSGPPAGAACTRNTDCLNPLSCTFGKCHETCREARDCPSGHNCIAVNGVGVCQLEGKCAYRSECPVPLVCALDRQCRSECKEDKDCATPTQKCVKPDLVCAEPAEIDPATMKLKAAQPTPVPFAPDGGVMDTGVLPADGAPPADGPGASVDAGAPADVPALPPDLAADLNLGDVPIGPCGFQDPYEPSNDMRETATPLAVGVPIQGCVAGKTVMLDPDYFELVAPNDPAGGYFQIAVTDVGPDKLSVTTYAASDNTVILNQLYPPDVGGSANLFFAAAPGQRYRILVGYGNYEFAYKMPFRYTIKATYTKVNDSYEPNDTRPMARPITLGMPITALLFAGFTTGHGGFNDGHLGQLPTTDWYKVEVPAAGIVKATVENAAIDVRVVLSIHDPLGNERTREIGGAGGGSSATFMMATPGTHYIQVAAFDQGPISAGGGQMVSASFTMPYTLTVTQ